jgi:hypothetical protein
MTFNTTRFYFYRSVSGLLYKVVMFLIFVYCTYVIDFGDWIVLPVLKVFFYVCVLFLVLCMHCIKNRFFL